MIVIYMTNQLSNCLQLFKYSVVYCLLTIKLEFLNKMDVNRYIWLIETLDQLLTNLLDGAPLTEERIYELCDMCLQNKVREPLIRALGEAFTQPAILSRCFPSKLPQDNANEGEKKTGEILIYKFIYYIN